MQQGRFLLVFFFVALVGISCEKQTDDIEKDPHHWFLDYNQFTFSGNIADSSVSWKFGPDFQSAFSGPAATGTTYLNFYLTSNADLTTRFEIITPGYSYTGNELFTSILSPGFKILGKPYEKFALKLTLNNITYSTGGDQSEAQFEILKVLKTKYFNGEDIAKTWIRANCNFYRPDGSFAFKLRDGYILSCFMYTR